MKKTHTLMMATAAALLTLNSCNDSNGGGGNTSVTHAISTTDFAAGTEYYSGTIGGMGCSVLVKAQAALARSSQVTDLPAGLVIEGAAVPFECLVSYSLEPNEQQPTTATMSFNFAGTTDNALRSSSEFCEFWNIDTEKSDADLEKEVDYRIVVEFPSGAATAIASARSGTLAATPVQGVLRVEMGYGSGNDSSDTPTQP